MVRFVIAVIASFSALASAVPASEPDAQGVDFFEKKIRPVLIEQCYSCHSLEAKKTRGRLVLDTREGLLNGGDSGPAVVSGMPDKSLLLRALRQTDELRMPPKSKLSDAVIADFERWIEMGLPDPRRSVGAPTPRRTAFRITDEDRNHWAFRPIADPKLPALKDSRWAANGIDHFVLAKLEGAKLQPAQPADRYSLIRRATYDLTGLPPTPAAIEAFLKDESPGAFGAVVDRLLASQEFGERWGRHWLDGVRYATDVDKSGLYREWVVRALNSDMPYDEFIRLQIASDLIPAKDSDPSRMHVGGASLENVPATGMLALAVWEEVGRDLAVAEIVDSQIDIVGRQLLGVTLACARCHDHKFDPISAEDYYALAGIFFSSHISDGKLIADGRLSTKVIEIPLVSRSEPERKRRLESEIAALHKQMAELEKTFGAAARLASIRAELRQQLPAKGKTAKTKDTTTTARIEQLRGEEKKLLDDRARQGWSETASGPTEIARLRNRIAALEKALLAPPVAIGIREGGVPGSSRQTIGDAAIYIRGDHRKEGPVVARRFPTILTGANAAPIARGSSGRLELANWIASPDNPLTARVMINRVWMHLFGQGLVRTPDNFGRLGEPPTHPELLDHLSRRFIASGWSVKSLIRDIVLSNSYRQGSFTDAATVRLDPENRFIGRVSRKRLEYEALRDSILFVSGQLTGDITAPERRTLYEPIERNRTNAMRSMFDGADPLAIVPERAATTTTPQALFLMNSPLIREAVKTLAVNLSEDASLKDDPARVTRAYLMLLGRPPSAEESRIGVEYMTQSTWRHYLQVLLCTNEFLYLD